MPGQPGSGALPTAVQHDVGRAGAPLAITIVGAVLLLGSLVASVLAGPTVLGWLVGSVVLVATLVWGLFPWLTWHGLQLRIDDEGVLFGQPRHRARPPFPVGLARQPYRVPWPSVSDVKLVEGAAAVTAMRQLAGGVQPTSRNGFFVRKGAPAHLSLFVLEPWTTALPWCRTLRAGTFTMTGSDSALNPSRRWLFPVRHADEVVAALQARGIPVERTAEPAVPVPYPEWEEAGSQRRA